MLNRLHPFYIHIWISELVATYCNYFILHPSQDIHGSHQPYAVHQQNVYLSLWASGSVWELFNQNQRVVTSQSLSDWCSGHQVHLGAPAINLCRHMWSGDSQGSIWERWPQAWEHQWQAWEHPRAPGRCLGVPVTSLGACPITVEQSGKNIIFFGNAAGLPGNHSYYILFNNFWNSWIQFVFSLMYLRNHIGIHQYMVYLDSLQVMLESNLRCAWRCWLCELSNTLLGSDQVSLEMQLEAEIEWTQRCTWRPWLSEFGDALGGHTQVRFEDTHGGCIAVNLGMHYKAVIEWVWRYSGRQWSTSYGDAPGGCNRAGLDVQLEARIKWKE